MVRYRSCKTCRQLKPQCEPHFSLYGNGLARRRQWKHVCNDCIDAAHEKRVRKSSAPALDGRDRRHPLEDVFMVWAEVTR